MTAAEAVLWPEREPLYALMLKRASDGYAAFESEKQNNPVDPSLCEWPPNCFEGDILFDKWPERLAIKMLALDPSKGPTDNRRESDYSAIVRYGRAHNGVEYVEADLKRRDTEQIVEDVVEAYIDFGPEELVVEANTFQELLIAPIQTEAARRGVDIAVSPCDNTVNKEVRIRRHGPYLHRRQVRFRRRSPGTALLIQQLKDFPNGDHDDGPDSWEMARRRAIDIFNGRKAKPAPKGYRP